jgi:hypothetical protein
MLNVTKLRSHSGPTLLRSYLRYALRTTAAIRHPTGVWYQSQTSVQSFKFMNKLLQRQTSICSRLLAGVCRQIILNTDRPC